MCPSISKLSLVVMSSSPSSDMGVEIEAGIQKAAGPEKKIKATKWTLLFLNCAVFALGNTGGPVLLRLYYTHGGSSKWLSSWLQTAGWPFTLLILSICYMNRRRKQGKDCKVFLITLRPLVACTFIGFLVGVNDYLYAYGPAYLPVSTLSLVVSTELVFNAVFCKFLVKQKFTPYSVNAIALLTGGAVVLGLYADGDRPPNESNGQYYLGFFVIICATALGGFTVPLIELTYMKINQTITFTLVMEMQMVQSFFATVFCTIGMLASGDFKELTREAREYRLGETAYYLVIISSAIFWQLLYIGMVGVVSCSSALHVGVLMAALLPVTEVLGVIFFKEKFEMEKGIALTLSLWGFTSYFYGEYKQYRKGKRLVEIEPREKQEMQEMGDEEIDEEIRKI